MDPVTLVLLAGFGAWVAIDATAFGQFLVSRPLVSGTVTGAVLGDPMMGAVIGGLLEALDLGALPVGGARLPEPGPAAIPAAGLAVAWAGPSIHASGAAVAGGLVLGIVLSWVGGETVRLQRRVNGRISARAWERGGNGPHLLRAQLAALGLDGLRGAILTGGGLLVARTLGAAGAPDAWPVSGTETIVLAGVGGALGLGRMVAGSAGDQRRVMRRPLLWFAVGIGCGVAVALALTAWGDAGPGGPGPSASRAGFL